MGPMKVGESFRYRGYWVKAIFGGQWTISKDGYHIATVKSIDAAKETIDLLV